MKNKIWVLIVLLLLLFNIDTVFAVEWWTQAGNFFQSGTASDVESNLLNTLEDTFLMISTIGNIIFFVVTVVLGVKYIWGAAESKANIKESMTTLVLAATVFYGWDRVQTIFLNNNFVDPNSFENTAEYIYDIIMYIANFAAIGGIIYLGVRYMLAGASGKADLKAKSVPALLGIVMVYCTLSFLTLISSII